MGDDPLMFADENGYIKLAGDKRVAVVSPQHQEVFWTMKDGKFVEGIECEIMLENRVSLSISCALLIRYAPIQ